MIKVCHFDVPRPVWVIRTSPQTDWISPVTTRNRPSTVDFRRYQLREGEEEGEKYLESHSLLFLVSPAQSIARGRQIASGIRRTQTISMPTSDSFSTHCHEQKYKEGAQCLRPKELCKAHRAKDEGSFKAHAPSLRDVFDGGSKVIQLTEAKLGSKGLSSGQENTETGTLEEYAIVLSFELS
ncbi:hypothetical protein B296_00052998 [Ensete ventricosum]|uniref:Uncharacterized protein n=1 Tax=Ensete ventricosum TaxID=4639 RepID=A0A426YA19_ENSVE|nr:hypothetical protein B296_00052998 [Ensete ventricosum]